MYLQIRVKTTFSLQFWFYEQQQHLLFRIAEYIIMFKITNATSHMTIGKGDRSHLL